MYKCKKCGKIHPQRFKDKICFADWPELEKEVYANGEHKANRSGASY